MEFRADLHCHTTCSDGSMTPVQLVQKAIDSGLQGLSITDHDTVAAYKSALPLAEKLGLEMIPGVEFSAAWAAKTGFDNSEEHVHILAYAFDLHHPDLSTFCEKQSQRRLKRNRDILRKLREHGMPLEEEELLKLGNPEVDPSKRVYARPHIAKLLIDKGYASSMMEVFHKWIGEGKCCYAPGENATVEDTLDLIHHIGGVAIIAHPHLIRKQKNLRRLLEMNFDGIEGYYALFPKDVQQKWVEIGTKKGWIVTGGSDFHGEAKPHIPLGCSWVNEETFRRLQNHQIEAST